MTISRLIMEGDWACASVDGDALVEICERIADLDSSFEPVASEVARWAARDMVIASTYWSDLAALLRMWQTENTTRPFASV